MISSLCFMQVEHTCSRGKCRPAGALCLRNVQDCLSDRCEAPVFIYECCCLYLPKYFSNRPIISVPEKWFSSCYCTLQVLGTCRSLSLSSDLKSLSVISEVMSTDNNPEICYIQVRWIVWIHLSVLYNIFSTTSTLSLSTFSFYKSQISCQCWRQNL